MPRCEGTTKSGSRCRRPAREGSAYCSSHGAESVVDADEPKKNTGESPGASETAASATKGRTSSARRPRSKDKHPLADVALVGVVAIALLALRRVIRF